MWGRYQLRYEMAAEEMLGVTDWMQEYKPSLLHVAWEAITLSRKAVNNSFSHKQWAPDEVGWMTGETGLWREPPSAPHTGRKTFNVFSFQGESLLRDQPCPYAGIALETHPSLTLSVPRLPGLKPIYTSAEYPASQQNGRLQPYL